MGEFDGVGRIYRTELTPPHERASQTERIDRDKRGKGQDPGAHDEEPQDTVEIHEEALPEPAEPKKTDPKQPKDRNLDISA